MARGNAKANQIKNKKRMALFKKITIGINLLVVAYHFAVKGDLLSVSVVLCIAFFAGQEYLALTQLEKFGLPQYGDGGQITSCVNLEEPKELGMYSYVQDMLWTCWAVQVLLLLSSWFWILYLAVPIYCIYRAWDSISPIIKRLMEQRAKGQTAFAPPGPGSRALPGQSRKEKRAAARQAEKNERNQAKAIAKLNAKRAKREEQAARPFPPGVAA